ncbi:hypothetical protein FBZ83_11985 [Azospirillum brasilense]|uniref:Uncharacterized protein n=1 Tax=Azospirillum brasilense TaxID=192 RepID=A0A560BUZ0_AZOBR|nr:hypothetical protein [Azospirillum brasilense]TWA76434.1 hypothetical protein FBZ83_11985 [Azospirillum brasilense]
MTDPLTLIYLALAVFVSLVIGAVVIGVLAWRGVSRPIARTLERMEARRAGLDRGARLTGCRAGW